MLDSSNSVKSFMAKQAMSNANTFLGRNVRYLERHCNVQLNMYNVDTNNIFHVQDDSFNASVLRDCVELRDGVAIIPGFTTEDAIEIILYCSTTDIWDYDIT